MQVQKARQQEQERSTSQQSQQPFVQSFKQQMLKAWLPIPTLTKTITLFFIMAAIFLGVGIPMMVLSNDIVEVTVSYDAPICAVNSTNCQVQIQIPQTMNQPVFLYYQLNNFYQNHRLYTSSISYEQLSGQIVSISDVQSTCTPIVTNGDLYVKVSINGVALNASDVANPCGIVAYSIFNDTFYILDSNNNNLSMTTDGIAWPSDATRFSVSNPNVTWLNYSDPRVMNWLRIASLSNFRKLWARIDTTLPAGNYTLFVNNSYTVSQFNTQKYFVLSTSNFFGSRNQFLSITYLVMGSVCLVIAIAFLIKKTRKQGKVQHHQ